MPEAIDVIDVLLRDHRVITGLAQQLDSVDDPLHVNRLYRRIVDELLAHEAAEHEVVFPAWASAGAHDADPSLELRLGEHDELNCMLREMAGLDPADFAFAKRASALLLELEGHFEREEQTVFARLRVVVQSEELIAMGERVRAVKRDARPTGGQVARQ